MGVHLRGQQRSLKEIRHSTGRGSAEWGCTSALLWAAKDLKGDHAIAVAAVQQDWRALRYATEELKGDQAVVLAAVQQDWQALVWAANALLLDDEFASEAKRNGFILKIYMASGRYTCHFARAHFSTAKSLSLIHISEPTRPRLI
eukprot:2234996-Amphidinium_carterae.1